MEYTQLGRSNIMVSKICLGTMHFGPYADEEASFRILDRTLEMGVNFIDTANVYGGDGNKGRSEEIIGKWFASRPGVRDEVVLATKVYNPMDRSGGPNDERGFSAYKVRKQAADSLRRLQTDRIDVYQVHHIDRRVSAEEFWGTYERLIADGEVLYAGSSNFSGWGLAKTQMQAWARGSVGLVSEQTQYNLLNRIPELEVLPAAQNFGVGVIAYMPLAGGLLTGKVQAAEGSRTRQLEEEYGIKLGADNNQFAEFSALCQGIGEREHVVATAWTLQHPAVASAIVGVRNVEQLDGLEQAARLHLDPETMQRLDDIFSINRGRKLRPGAAPEAYAW
ncbi:MAG: L-fuco-beta-pyranose dehydrogenase [uncultured Truepera sp.]|uniref:L-fuco-beta-pyranose dehydrogenase n=1 Tax=uncultured Truepera sp. TaxID=543023 RepID=A0A6J4V577_9DEIN|nr:MAG: L-fuco-beta-pyranose dehydrogenase [uncultured Truepera sp.]